MFALPNAMLDDRLTITIGKNFTVEGQRSGGKDKTKTPIHNIYPI
jgi:hypothetical protein